MSSPTLRRADWMPLFNENRDAIEIRRTPSIAPVVRPDDPRWERPLVQRTITPERGPTTMTNTDGQETGSTPPRRPGPRDISDAERSAAIEAYQRTKSVNQAAKAIDGSWDTAAKILREAGIDLLDGDTHKPGPKPRAKAPDPGEPTAPTNLRERLERIHEETNKALEVLAHYRAIYGDDEPDLLRALVLQSWQKNAGVRLDPAAKHAQ